MGLRPVTDRVAGAPVGAASRSLGARSSAAAAVCDDAASSPRAAAQIDVDRSEGLIDRHTDATSADPRSARPGHDVD
jgi:hypothetical protein